MNFDFFYLLELFWTGDSKKFTMEYADAILFHSPYCKLIQKSVGRLLLNDYLIEPFSTSNSSAVLEKFKWVKAWIILSNLYYNCESLSSVYETLAIWIF